LLSFSEPYLFGRDLKFSAEVGRKTTTNATQNYRQQRDTLSPAIDFPISDRGRLGLRYRYTNMEISETSADSSVLITGDEGARQDHSLGYYYTFDSRRNKIEEDYAYVFQFRQDFGLSDTDPYMRATALAGAETSLFDDYVQVRAVVEGGFVKAFNSGNTRVYDRFNSSTSAIRGFENFGIGPRDLNADNKDPLGGNMFAVLRLEADFPIGIPEEYGISGGVFFDAGSYWGLDNTAGGPTGAACPVADCTVDDSFKLRSVVGFALYWSTPIGPLRFNFTKAIKKESYDVEQPFELTISTKF
jgi:outer membrane protein insertion porin family